MGALAPPNVCREKYLRQSYITLIVPHYAVKAVNCNPCQQRPPVSVTNILWYQFYYLPRLVTLTYAEKNILGKASL